MQTIPKLYRWTRAEYERLAEQGAFMDTRVELIGGMIVEMAAKGPVHVVANTSLRWALERVFPRRRFTVRIQDPLALGEWDAPEPDAAVVIGRNDAYRSGHPTAAQTVLVVEIADSSVAYDLGDKADICAAAGIDDYWVVNIPAGTVVVLREPRPDGASETGHRYAERREYRPGEQIAPLAEGARAVMVAELLP